MVPPMTIRAQLTILALLTASLFIAGCVQDAPQTNEGTPEPPALNPARDPTSPFFKPHVVVAVIDTGNNPYHIEYAENYDPADPAEYIPDYPTDVQVLKLSPWTAGSSNREKADEGVWANTTNGVLYRYEGTKIVGHISFAGGLPGSGHGTMTASRATGNTISVGGNATRLVVVQGFTAESITWAADQPWIDIISISSGVSGGIIAPGLANVMSPDMMKVFQAAALKKPFFASSGNGIANAGLLGFPTWMRGPSGVPDVISVGANENGKMAIWHNFQPYIVGDGCANPSVQDNHADSIRNTGGGTSSATPFSAGTGAAMLLEARRLLGDTHVGVRYSQTPIQSFSAWDSFSPTDDKIIMAQGNASLHGITTGPLADGVFTAKEFKDVLYHTAISGGTVDASDGDECELTARGTVEGGMVPGPVRAQYEGYGEVNAKSMVLAFEVLAGTKPNPVRAVDDLFYSQFHTARRSVMPP
jgi:hypothetical protein